MTDGGNGGDMQGSFFWPAAKRTLHVPGGSVANASALAHRVTTQRCVVAIASVVADSENHAVDIHRGVSVGPLVGLLPSLFMNSKATPVCGFTLSVAFSVPPAETLPVTAPTVWAGGPELVRRRDTRRSRSPTRSLLRPLAAGQVDDGQRDPMLSRESLEAYRRMTAGQRLALTLQAMRDPVPHLLHGPREIVQRRFALIRRENDLRSRHLASRRGRKAYHDEPRRGASGCGLRGHTSSARREEGSVTGRKRGETDRISNRLSSSRYGQSPSVSPRKSGLVDYAEGRQAARLSPGFCASRSFSAS